MVDAFLYIHYISLLFPLKWSIRLLVYKYEFGIVTNYKIDCAPIWFKCIYIDKNDVSMLVLLDIWLIDVLVCIIK